MSERDASVRQLREQLQRIDRTRAAGRRAPVRLGVPAVDDALPWGGFARGGLHELVGDWSDGGALGFTFALLARLPAGEGRILWCRGPAAWESGRPYGPGVAAFGLAPARLLFFDAKRADAGLWALEEGLRCRRLAAVVGQGLSVGLAESRRLQLAAETGDTLGLLLDGSGEPSPLAAFTRWYIASLPAAPDRDGVGRSRWSLALRRCRGGTEGRWILEFDDEALCLHLAADLADGSLAAAE